MPIFNDYVYYDVIEIKNWGPHMSKDIASIQIEEGMYKLTFTNHQKQGYVQFVDFM